VLGLYSATPQGPFIPGLEFSGIVIKSNQIIASNSSNSSNSSNPPKNTRHQFSIGEKVVGVTRFGAYSSHLNVDTRYVWPLPIGWSFEQGAALIAQGLTAWYGLRHLARVGEDGNKDVVLVHSAAGGVGLLALQLLERLECPAVATVGDSSKATFLEELKHVTLSSERIIVRTRGAEFGSQLDTALQTLNKANLDVVFDSLAGEYFWPGYDRLSPGGRLVVYGSGSMMPSGDRPNWLLLAWQWLWRPRLDPLSMIQQNKSVMGFNLIWLWDRVDQMGKMVDEFFAFGWSPPHVGRVFEFEKAPDALRFFQTGKNVGKVVLLVKH